MFRARLLARLAELLVSVGKWFIISLRTNTTYWGMGQACKMQEKRGKELLVLWQ